MEERLKKPGDHVVLLVGGVGGAKLALGLARVLPPGSLTIIVNTGDDFNHLGLHISPDVDTVMYTLSNLVNPKTGWGLNDDSLHAMRMVRRYGGPDWFSLGDKDLGTHLMRTQLLSEGLTLTEVTGKLCSALGVEHPLLPMSDDPVRTVLDTDQGTLNFQEYFVRERWQPVARDIRFEGSEKATPSEAVLAALEQASMIVIGPSNPFLSIDPILSVPGIRERIESASVPRVAISPIIAGKAVKGPTAKMMAEMGIDVSPVGVIDHYRNLLDGIILDEADGTLRDKIESIGMHTSAQQILMETQNDKIRLAVTLLHWVEENLS
ncbi:MAG: 2-phospho-L-lactate transferase [Anaerolineae bacterium]|nr:2-phospho-L-lactate transferase [Anaerolineae bacterium]